MTKRIGYCTPISGYSEREQARRRAIIERWLPDDVELEIVAIQGGVVFVEKLSDFGEMEKAAGTSAAATAVDPRLQEKLSPQFLQLRMKTHQRFAQLAAAAKSGATRDDALKRLAAITGYCVACHAAYRLEETR